MTSLLLASENIDSTNHWIRVLDSIYLLDVSENLGVISSGALKNKVFSLLILDVSLINEVHSLAYLNEFFKKILVVGENLTHREQIQLIFDGACGYSDKAIDQQMIKRAIDGVLNGELWLERQLIPQVLKGIVAKQYSSKIIDRFDDETFETLSILTQREIEVIEHIYNGENNSVIANSLFISVRTVKAHLTAIYKKLNVIDRFELVVYLKNLHVSHFLN